MQIHYYNVVKSILSAVTDPSLKMNILVNFLYKDFFVHQSTYISFPLRGINWSIPFVGKFFLVTNTSINQMLEDLQQFCEYWFWFHIYYQTPPKLTTDTSITAMLYVLSYQLKSTATLQWSQGTYWMLSNSAGAMFLIVFEPQLSHPAIFMSCPSCRLYLNRFTCPGAIQF